jgi:DNA mismatch endonuclease (patch repair protein)
MADQFSSEERSAIMRRVRSVDTKPELQVRRMVHRLGFRFRLHAQSLPGKPDLVFRRRKQAVFVHGCYWHQHKCDAAKRPATNRRYWNRKLDKNVQRDKRNLYLLRRQGWRVLTVWECELRNTERLERRLFRFLNSGAYETSLV